MNILQVVVYHNLIIPQKKNEGEAPPMHFSTWSLLPMPCGKPTLHPKPTDAKSLLVVNISGHQIMKNFFAGTNR
jgi:hypothetical protein